MLNHPCFIKGVISNKIHLGWKLFFANREVRKQSSLPYYRWEVAHEKCHIICYTCSQFKWNIWCLPLNRSFYSWVVLSQTMTVICVLYPFLKVSMNKWHIRKKHKCAIKKSAIGFFAAPVLSSKTHRQIIIWWYPSLTQKLLPPKMLSNRYSP